MYQSPMQQYALPQESYLEQWIKERGDFTRHIPLKAVDFDSHLFQAGIYGWTYLASSKTTRDRFLVPGQAYKTDTHECIHTEWEYETRTLTDWILSNEINRYDRISLTKKEEEKYYSTNTINSIN